MQDFFSADTLAFIAAHQDDDVAKLALKFSSRKDIDIRAALQQIEGRQIAKSKLPSFANAENIVYPVKLSMEQCSSEKTALYKQSVAGDGASMIDLTSGFGIDFYFISRHFKKAEYVERNADLCRIASHNFKSLGATNVSATNADGIELIKASTSHYDLIFLDPARRDKNGKKTVEIKDCEPDVVELKETLLSKCDRMMLKLSPMLDIKSAVRDLGCVEEVHVVAVDNECKELLFVCKKGASFKRIVAANIKPDGKTEMLESTSASPTGCSSYSAPLTYLYEPNVAILKANISDCLASEKVKKIAPFSHLFTSDELCEDFPGRKFEVEKIFSMNKKELKENLDGIKRANITCRNFPLQADELRKKLGIKEGGDKYIIATTDENGNHLLTICQKL
ncbi:MAG: class I SAM-dependent methyltransferase [Paludibacteraceae bacterium]|nr:class I SAM-dependent methyltransferase [Paludibacteraceae bacterium]